MTQVLTLSFHRPLNLIRNPQILSLIWMHMMFFSASVPVGYNIPQMRITQAGYSFFRGNNRRYDRNRQLQTDFTLTLWASKNVVLKFMIFHFSTKWLPGKKKVSAGEEQQRDASVPPADIKLIYVVHHQMLVRSYQHFKYVINKPEDKAEQCQLKCTISGQTSSAMCMMQ